ncbi:MAG TPA: hypothetical protein VMW53_07275 [archaeon]|nr:hypothetical protein [archaeon]
MKGSERITYYRNKPIENFTRDELIDALSTLYAAYKAAIDKIDKFDSAVVASYNGTEPRE